MNGRERAAWRNGGVPVPLIMLVLACSPGQNGHVDSANPPSSVVSIDSRVTMERQPCFGTCPVYTVDVTAAGQVTFTGTRFVDSIGTMTRQIGPESGAALMHELDARGIFELADSYTHGAKECGSYHTDAPRVNLSVRINGRTKTISHDYGCTGAPAVLRSMQEHVDSVAGVSRWIGQR